MDLSDTFRRAAKALAKLEKAGQTWDFRAFEKYSSAFAEDMSRLVAMWEAQITQVFTHLQEKRAVLGSQTYWQEVENSLRRAGLPVEGSFPCYHIPPFDLHVAPEEGVVRLRLGRSIQKAGSFEPAALTHWATKRYTAAVKRPFNSRRFFRNLLSAYHVGNRLTYSRKRGQELWGQPVALEYIYELLTIRKETRADYPREHFQYDLARLRNSDSGLTHNQYSLEFGYSRDQGRSFIIRDLSSGREERFSSLAIHRREG